MYQYKVLHVAMKMLEEVLNQYAAEYWRVVSIVPDGKPIGPSFWVHVTLERPKLVPLGG